MVNRNILYFVLDRRKENKKSLPSLGNFNTTFAAKFQ